MVSPHGRDFAKSQIETKNSPCPLQISNISYMGYQIQFELRQSIEIREAEHLPITTRFFLAD